MFSIVSHVTEGVESRYFHDFICCLPPAVVHQKQSAQCRLSNIPDSHFDSFFFAYTLATSFFSAHFIDLSPAIDLPPSRQASSLWLCVV